MTATQPRAAEDYLRAVDRALGDLPRARRDEIMAGLREHVDAALAEHPGDDAYVRAVLDRLGSPADIAADARERFGITGRPPRRILEVVALLLLTAGSLLLPVVGWLVGIVLVFLSRMWSPWHKTLAVVLFPFGFLPTLYVVFYASGVTTTMVCTGSGNGPEVCATSGGTSPVLVGALAVLFALSALGPLVTAFVLGRALRRERHAAA